MEKEMENLTVLPPRGEAGAGRAGAASASDPSILTSSLVLFCATMGVSMISDIEIIGSICTMLARGALISAIISIFIMPSILCVCEPIFAKTSRNWRTEPKPRLAAAKKETV